MESDQNLTRQRADLASPPLRVEIDHGYGMVAFDGEAAVAFVNAQPGVAAAWPPIPDLTSILSAEPALLYRCGDLAIPLTASELAALFGGDLTPEEISRLTMVFGPAWEWGGTFYASNSQAQLRPKGLRAQVMRAAGVAGRVRV